MPIRKIKAGLVLTKDVDEFVGEPGYLFYDEDSNGDQTLRISDGVTPGGLFFSNNRDSTVTNTISSLDSTAVAINDNLIPAEDNTFSLGSPDKQWASLHVSGSTIFIGDIALQSTVQPDGSASMQVLSKSTPGENTQDIENDFQASTIQVQNIFSVVGDDSTGTSFNTGETLKISGTQNITTAMTGDTLTVTGPDLTSYVQQNDDITTNIISSSDSTAVQVADNFVPAEDNVYSLGTPDKRFSEIHVAEGSIFLGGLVLKDRGDGAMQVFQSDGVTPADIIYAKEHTISIVGDDSTGTAFNLDNSIKFTGTGGITVSVSGDDVTIDGSGVAGGGGSSTLTVSDDASTTVNITTGQDTLKFAGGNNITTALTGDTLTIDGPDTGFTFVGDDSTGTAFDTTQSPNIRFLGAGNVTVAVSGSNVIITGSGAGGSATYTQDSPPDSPTDGETWFDTDSGGLYVFVEEGGSGQWIETGSAGSTLDAESVTSFKFGVDDSGIVTISQGETLSILGGQGIATDITGDGEIRISSTGASVTTSDTAPTSPSDGDLWWNTSSGSLYIYLNEDSSASANWIETAGSGQAGGGGITSLAADATPELGGNLDANAYNINNVGTISVATNGDPGVDPATDSGVGYIYAKGTTAELFVKDGAGNITQISPHSEEGDWVYYSENVKTGKRVKVNMEKMIRRLEEITGETFFEIDDPHKINY